jgi:hypothetical protein
MWAEGYCLQRPLQNQEMVDAYVWKILGEQFLEGDKLRN